MNKLSFIITGATAAMLLLPAKSDAQQLAEGLRGANPVTVLKKERKTSPAVIAAQTKEAAEEMPQLFKGRVFKSNSTPGLRRLNGSKKLSPMALTPRIPLRPSESAGIGRELWGDVVQDKTWGSSKKAFGIYKFNAGNNMSVDLLSTTNAMPTGSGAIVGNRLYYIYYYGYYGTVYPYFFEYDTDTWSPISEYEYLSDVSLIATETAVSADGKVYGEFYNSVEGTSYELGIADYANRTRTSIGTLKQFYVAMGMTSENDLYGISTDGNLYKIDITTAKETLVGPTGLTVSNANGAYFYQSGEIDQKTNTFYWATAEATESMEDAEVASLYTVDLTTGAATKVGDFENQNLIMLMNVPVVAADGAPAAVSDIVTSFSEGAKNGTVTFKAPTETADGTPLTGELNYSIALGTDVLASGTTTAGSVVTADVTFATEGNKMLTIYASNSEGDGVKTKKAVYVGIDTPKAVSGLKLNIDNETCVATLNWDAVTEGVNGGYIGNVKYDVTRYPDNKVVATNLTDTSFSETLTKSGIQTISYGVTVSNSKNVGTETVSDGVMFGNAVVPPYENTFSESGSFDLLTIIDANNDGRTWAYYAGLSSENNGTARYKYSKSGLAADDWLVTPPIKVEKGKFYNLSFKMHTSSASNTERFEVKYGKGNTADALTEEVIPATSIASADFVEYKQDIIPTEDGVIYIGFHDISAANHKYLFLDDVKLEEGKSYLAPGAVTDLTVTPAAKGERKVTINFNAPTKAIDGTSAPTDMSITIYRDGAAIKTFTGVSAGEALTFVDIHAVDGLNSYKVVASSAEYGNGPESETVTVYVGTDAPNIPQSLQLTDNSTSVHISWNASETGVNGGYVDPQSVFYKIYNITNDNGVTMAELADSTAMGATGYDAAYNTNEGVQDLLQYGVASYNEDGNSSIALTPTLIVGEPYTLPFFESVEGKVYSYDLWWVNSYGGSSTFSTSSESSDGDGGCFAYTSNDTNEYAVLGTGKITLKGAKNPTLLFKHVASASSDAIIYVYAQKPDGSKSFLKYISYADMANAGSWKQEAIELSKEFTNLDYIFVTFECHANTGESIGLDEITVRDVYGNDLAVNDVTAPLKVKKGATAKVSVKVANEGNTAATGYTVKLYADDKLIASKTESGSLAAFASKTYEMEYKSSVMNENSSAKLKAEVEYTADEYTSNNSKATTVDFIVSKKPCPESVTASETGSGSVTVNWVAPTEYSQTNNDGFEDYTSWATDEFGDWKGVTGNTNALTDGPFYDCPVPTEESTYAFTVADPLNGWITDEILSSYPSYAAHAGDKYVASFYKYDSESGVFVDADEWLISPSLSGKAQTVKFWVSNHTTEDTNYPETFDVLYSKTGNETTDFIKIGNTHTASTGTWQEVSVDIPAGATYFAIHQNTVADNTFVFQIDDVTYEGGSGAVIGYNVYRDGELLKTISGTETLTFTDNTAEGDKTYVYAVTALFADGESEATAAAAITTDIENVEAAVKASSYDVYTLDGKLIGNDMKSLKGLKSGSYIINNQKVIIK